MVTESLVLWSHGNGYWTVTEYDPVPALSTECIGVTIPKSLDCNHSLVSFPDHFLSHREKWSGKWPIPFSFHMPECWWANLVALHF